MQRQTFVQSAIPPKNDIPPESDITATGVTTVSLWRACAIALLRVAFAIVWAIDAWFKWQPDFMNSFVDQVAVKPGQPASVQSWLTFWSHVISSNPHLFAILTASVETALAVFLLLGLLNNLVCSIGFLWSLAVWAIPEGFGGPYKPGDTTDIGTAIPYALMFAMLFAVAAGRYYGLDRWLTLRLGRLGILASGRLWKQRQRHRAKEPVVG